MMETDAGASPSGKDRRASRIILYLAVALVLSGGVALVVSDVPAVLSVFSTMGKNGLTVDELQALDMLKDLNGQLEPLQLNLLGWVGALAPLAVLAWFAARRQDRSDLPGATDHALFCAVAALIGVSLGLLFHFADGVFCAVFVVGAITVAGWLHAGFVDAYFSRARNAATIAGVFALVGGIGSRSWLMAAVPLIVFGLIGFAVLLVRDLRGLQGARGETRDDPIRSDVMLAALSLYLSLAGAAVSILGLVG